MPLHLCVFVSQMKTELCPACIGANTGVISQLTNWNSVQCKLCSSSPLGPLGPTLLLYHSPPNLFVQFITIITWHLQCLQTWLQQEMHEKSFSSFLLSFMCSSHRTLVIGVTVCEGLAGPTGWPILCMRLIKHSFLIEAPNFSHPSVLLSSLSRPCDAQ